MINKLIEEYGFNELNYFVFNNNFDNIYDYIKLFISQQIIDDTLAIKNKYYSFFIGIFKENINKDYKNMKKYYKIAIKLNNSDAIYYLGRFL